MAVNMHRNSITLFSAVVSTADKAVKVSAAAKECAAPSTILAINEMMNQVCNTIITCSSLPGQEGNAATVVAARHEIDAEVLKRFSHSRIEITTNLLLKLFSIAIKTQRAGNCYEFSIFMQALLSKTKLRSEIFRIDGGNHVFIVLNRDQSLAVNDYANWNEGALIVDPFFQSIYLPNEIPTNLQSCVHDIEHNLVSYEAFNPVKHKLLNDVLDNLMEDWQAIISAKNTSQGSSLK